MQDDWFIAVNFEPDLYAIDTSQRTGHRHIQPVRIQIPLEGEASTYCRGAHHTVAELIHRDIIRSRLWLIHFTKFSSYFAIACRYHPERRLSVQIESGRIGVARCGRPVD